MILFLILFSLVVQAQKINPDGYNKFYYPNGKVSSEGYMKDGKPDGYWKTYYVTGVIKSEGNRSNYKLDSIWVFYNTVGDTLEKINFKYGKKNGYYYKYEYDVKNPGVGYIASKELYVNDKIEGKAYYYYDGKKIKRVINYIDGKKQGMAFEYDRNGKVSTILEYRNNYLISRQKINRENKKGLKQGVWKEFYPDGKLHYEKNYVDGKLNGYFKEYDTSGNLKFVIRYENGKVVNEQPNESENLEIRNEYDDNGNLIFSGPFRENVPVGIHRRYSPDGKVISSKIYDNMGNVISVGIVNENGEKNGEWKDYYSGGELKDEGKYENNNRTGSWKFYRKNGKVEQTGIFRNDKYHGLWTWYYPDGNILREEEYFIGNEEGLSVEYSEAGDIIAKGEYINGEKEGKWYYNAGDQIEEGSYVTGLREGIWKYYYSDGTLKYSGNYIQGMPDGRHKYYYPDKSLKEEQYYKMGSKEKTWKKYDTEGNVILTISYKNDLEKSINGVKVTLKEDIKRIETLDGK
jgi:antitoxin component YwqK of YwqJK toxin-antitoxin module